jgi:hypothetical protein
MIVFSNTLGKVGAGLKQGDWNLSFSDKENKKSATYQNLSHCPLMYVSVQYFPLIFNTI